MPELCEGCPANRNLEGEIEGYASGPYYRRSTGTGGEVGALVDRAGGRTVVITTPRYMELNVLYERIDECSGPETKVVERFLRSDKEVQVCPALGRFVCRDSDLIRKVTREL